MVIGAPSFCSYQPTCYARMFPILLYFKMSTCRPATHPRRSTLWPKCVVHIPASKCQPVNLPLTPEGQHIDQYVSYTSLPQNVGLSPIPEAGRHFDQNISCTSLLQNVNLLTCHLSHIFSYTVDLYLHWIGVWMHLLYSYTTNISLLLEVCCRGEGNSEVVHKSKCRLQITFIYQV